MKPVLIALLAFLVCLVGCGKKEPPEPQAKKKSEETTKKDETEKSEPPKVVSKKLIADPIVEKAIREAAKKPTGELTEADLEKVMLLNLNSKQLTDVKGLQKLPKLTLLHLENNPHLTKAQITELQKALPKCDIRSNPKNNHSSL